MAKIQITESELKQLIRESVEAVLNEDFDARMARQANRRQNRAQNAWNNYQTVYNDPNATDAQKERARRSYYRKNLRNGFGNLARAQEAEKEVSNLKGQVANLTTSNKDLQGQVAERDKTIAGLQGSVGQLQRANKNLNTKLAQANQQNASLQQRMQNGTLPTPSKAAQLPTNNAIAQKQGGLAPRSNVKSV